MKNAVQDSAASTLRPSLVLTKVALLAEYLGLVHIPQKPSTLFALYTVGLFLVFMAAFAFLARYLARNAKAAPPAEWACRALLACCLLHMLWWIGFSSAVMARYAAQGLIYGSAALALAIGRGDDYKCDKRAGNLLLLAALLIALRYDAVAYLWTDSVYDESFKEQRTVLQKIETVKRQAPETVFFSCGYTFELEYLLPQSRNFVECERLTDPAFASSPRILLSLDYYGDGKVMNFDQKKFVTVWRENIPAARAACPVADIFAGKHYSIASCK